MIPSNSPTPLPRTSQSSLQSFYAFLTCFLKQISQRQFVSQSFRPSTHPVATGGTAAGRKGQKVRANLKTTGVSPNISVNTLSLWPHADYRGNIQRDVSQRLTEPPNLFYSEPIKDLATFTQPRLNRWPVRAERLAKGSIPEPGLILSRI